MCGIVAYLGQNEAIPVILSGLKRLEYRGYDSAGVSIMQDDSLIIYKKQGKVSDLEKHLAGKNQSSTIGMGHTRWATHGEPNDINAHPHYGYNKSLSIIHNGIIENYSSLKKELEQKGVQFTSETDTEVLASFIESIKSENNLSIESAVQQALMAVDGAYAIVVMDKENPDKLVAARKGSPMVLGVGDGEYFVASDATPIIEHTDDVVYLKDEEIAIIERDAFRITNIKDEEQTPYIQKIELELDAIEKGGYEHFMLKEIFEQPNSIADSMRGRLDVHNAKITLGGIQKHLDTLVNAPRIIILGCGTSWHSGLVAEYFFEEYCRIPVEVEYASEFRYRNPVINKGDVVIAISQSGETADTLAAIELAKSKGAIILGVVNVVGSSISRITDEGAYLHTGPEIGVASTKAFTGQLSVLSMIALTVARRKGTITEENFRNLINDLSRIPQKIKEVLETNDKIEFIADLFKNASNFIYLGRGYNFPVALEGALKLKEISYIHAEGYPAAEMKHGPIALIDEDMPVVFIATRDSSYDKVVSNIQEVKARKGTVIAVVTKGDALIPKMADFVIEVPKCEEALMPMISVIPLQLLSYHIAIMRGCNVDQPRNLAKSVTVE